MLCADGLSELNIKNRTLRRRKKGNGANDAGRYCLLHYFPEKSSDNEPRGKKTVQGRREEGKNCKAAL